MGDVTAAQGSGSLPRPGFHASVQLGSMCRSWDSGERMLAGTGAWGGAACVYVGSLPQALELRVGRSSCLWTMYCSDPQGPPGLSWALPGPDGKGRGAWRRSAGKWTASSGLLPGGECLHHTCVTSCVEYTHL